MLCQPDHSAVSAVLLSRDLQQDEEAWGIPAQGLA